MQKHPCPRPSRSSFLLRSSHLSSAVPPCRAGQSRSLRQPQPQAGVPLPPPSLPCTDSPKKHQNKLSIFPLLETPEEEPCCEPPWEGPRAAHPGRSAVVLTTRHGKACSFREREIRNDVNGCGGAWAALWDCTRWFLGVIRKMQDAHLHYPGTRRRPALHWHREHQYLRAIHRHSSRERLAPAVSQARGNFHECRVMIKCHVGIGCTPLSGSLRGNSPAAELHRCSVLAQHTQP